MNHSPAEMAVKRYQKVIYGMNLGRGIGAFNTTDFSSTMALLGGFLANDLVSLIVSFPPSMNLSMS